MVGKSFVKPFAFSGRGVVICGGGIRYFTCAWVCINILRKLGCTLPVEVWHFGKAEMSREMQALLAPLNAVAIDALEFRKKYPVRILNGWELKPYAIIHSSFEEVLFLDADNVPVVNPEFLFETPQYKETGAIFWPDFENLTKDNPIWEICGADYRDEPEVESGQLLIDKNRCWRALNIALHLNEYSDFYYRLIYGDKDTFHMAWRSLGQPFSMTEYPLYPIEDTRCHFDFEGRRVFQHRNTDKWSLQHPNKRIEGFELEEECFEFLEQLRKVWDQRIPFFEIEDKSENEKEAISLLESIPYTYRRVGYDQRTMRFEPEGIIGEGAEGCERFWDITQKKEGICLGIYGEGRDLTCELRLHDDEIWRGQWLRHEKMAIELKQQKKKTRTLIIQQGDGEHREMLAVSDKWHEAYAKRHDMDYWIVYGRTQIERHPIWDKIQMIREALKKHYELIVWLDADTLIVDVNEDLRNAMSEFNYVGMCKHFLPWDDQPWHYNAGVIFVRNGERTKNFFDNVWKAGPLEHPWQEQVRMMEQGRLMPGIIQELDAKWNSQKDNNPSPNPVIKAWHNERGRVLSMSDHLEKIKGSSFSEKVLWHDPLKKYDND